MEGKITKLLVSTGIVMAAAVSMIPLTSYAAVVPRMVEHGFYCDPKVTDETASNYCAQDSSTEQVSVNVASVLELDAAGTKMEGIIPAYPDMIRNNFLDVKVRSAVDYTISISAEDPFLTKEDNDSMIIRAKSGIEADGIYGWGIKKKTSQDSDDSSYTAIGTASETFFTGKPTDTIATRDEENFVTTKFDVGVRASEQNTQGTYSTDINITAAVKN